MQDNPNLIQEDLSQPKSLREYLRLYFSGFAMGASDIVPGVSGGTMAFILGVYTTLIDSIKSFNLDVVRSALKFDIQAVFDKVPFRFLIALGLGVISAIFLLASLLHNLLDEEPTFLFAFFAGLIIASIVAIGIKVRWSAAAMAALAIFSVVAFVITGLEEPEEPPLEAYIHALERGGDIDATRATLLAELEAIEYANAAAEVEALTAAVLNDGDVEPIEDELDAALYQPSSPLVLFVSGSIAICAMLLPGISGSFILLILGQYAIVLGAVNTFDIPSLMAVAAGAAFGMIAFSRVIAWLLKHYENVTVAALVGFMLGSLHKIWLEMEAGMAIASVTGELSMGQWGLVAALMLFGFLLVSFLDHLQSRTNPIFAWLWKPAPARDDIAQKAEALD